MSVLLTTRANVRAFLQKPTADTAQDAVIDSLIARASAAVERYTEREFHPTTDATRVFECEFKYGGAQLDLAPYEFQGVGANGYVKLDTDLSSPRTLGADEFRLGPKPAIQGTYKWIRLVPTGWGGFHRFGTREVTVRGDWGQLTVPDDVEQAVIVTVAIWMRRDVSVFSTAMNLTEDRVERPEALPSAVARMLQPYCRASA